MIKDVMVRTSGDDVRLAAVSQIAETFKSHLTGLFFNVLPPAIPDGFNAASASQITKLLDAARAAGDVIEATVLKRLTGLPYPTNFAGVRRNR